jgi:hypothetical protein
MPSRPPATRRRGDVGCGERELVAGDLVQAVLGIKIGIKMREAADLEERLSALEQQLGLANGPQK